MLLIYVQKYPFKIMWTIIFCELFNTFSSIFVYASFQIIFNIFLSIYFYFKLLKLFVQALFENNIITQ